MVTSCGFYDRQVTLLVGTSCTRTECVESDSFFRSCFRGSGIRWHSIQGRAYYVIVHGSSIANFGSSDLRVGQLPENDFCEDATALTLNTEIHEDTSFTSRVEMSSVDEFPAAETCVDIDHSAVSSDDYSIQQAGGLWYVLDGNNQAMTARTYCTDGYSDGFIETQIAVFSGSCETLMCVAGSGNSDIQSYSGDFCPPNQIEWFAQSDQTYFIHVHGAQYGDEGTGKFSLIVQETNSIVPTLPPIIDQTNDFCADAIGPFTLGEKISGWTDGAQNSQAPECGSASEQRGSGAWYYFEGTGEEIHLTTCNDDGYYYSTNDDFHRQVSVFKGPCEALDCVAGKSWDSNNHCYGEAGLSWQSNFGQTYYILVHGEFLGSSGSFVLRLGTQPLNNLCEDAISLEMNVLTPGYTFFASDDQVGPCGGATRQTSSGVWYEFTNEEPAAKAVIATTCAPEAQDNEATVAVQLAVFQGSCDRLFCVDGSSVEPEGICQSSKEAGVAWLAETGMKYYILVYHRDYDLSGSFGILVRETAVEVTAIAQIPAPENDRCDGAITLPAEGFFLEGSTVGADYDTDMFPNADAPGVWYWFNGTGGELNPFVEEMSAGYWFDVALLEARNPCTDSEDFYYSSYSGFLSEKDKKYFMFVHSGYRVSTGSFFVGLNKSSTYCSRARALKFDEIIEGDTTFGNYISWTSGYDHCGMGTETRSLWYSFQAGDSDEDVTVTTCTGNVEEDVDVDTRLSVFYFLGTGHCSGIYYCETWNEDDPSDSCIGEASVSWTALAGKQYFITVSTLAIDVGRFFVVLRRQ